MVAYLKKPTGSEGFQEIVDFLNGTHIRYALTKNPTIYVCLIEQFWQTATVRTVDNREQEITARVDGKEFAVTEASVKRHLQLANADGISVLPNTEIFDQLSLMGVERAATTAASLDVEQASGNINRSQSTVMPNVNLPWGIGACGSPRCQEAIRGSIAQTRSERVPTPSYDSPLLGVHIPRSDEERFEQHELTGNVQQQSYDPPLSRVSERVLSLEESTTAQDLVIKRLKLRVKKLEKKKKKARTPQPLKRRLFKVRVGSFAKENLDEGDPSKQGRREVHSQEYQPEDQLKVVSAAKVLADATRKNVQTYTKRKRAVSTGSGGISTASSLFSTAKESISTTGASMPVSTVGMVQKVNIPSPVAVKDKGKGKLEESKDEQSKRTKLQQEQDRLGYEAAVRLQEELDEEERQRMAKVHKAAQSFTEEEWESIRARRKRYFAAQKAEAKRNKPMTQAQQRAYMSSYIKNMGGSKRQKTNEALGSEQPDEEENELSQEDLQQMMMVVPMDEVYVEALQVKYPIIDWEVKLKRLFEPDTEDTLWKLQREKNGYFHAGRERISIVKKDSDFESVNKLLVDQHSKMELNPSHLVLTREEFILPSLVSTTRAKVSTDGVEVSTASVNLTLLKELTLPMEDYNC
nr:hypothetical protein [Tanacetum cinerariifolium]